MKNSLFLAVLLLTISHCSVLKAFDKDYIQPPLGAETHLYRTQGNVYPLGKADKLDARPEDADYCVEVAFVENELYVKGLFLDVAPEAWLKGEFDGDNATFPDNQYVGKVEHPDYGCIDVWHHSHATPLQLKYDKETGRFTHIDGDLRLIREEDSFTDIYVISFPQLEDYAKITDKCFDLVVPPTENAIAYKIEVDVQEGSVEGFSDSHRIGRMIISGDDFYIQGLSTLFDTWVKGTRVDDRNVHFPVDQYVGVYHLAKNIYCPVWFGDINGENYKNFVWDSETLTLSIEKAPYCGYYEVDINNMKCSWYINTVVRVVDDAGTSTKNVIDFTNDNAYSPICDLYGIRHNKSQSSRGFMVEMSKGKIIYHK